MDINQLKNIVEAALLAAGEPLDLNQLAALFEEEESPERNQLREALDALNQDYAERGVELKEVGSGWRLQVRTGMKPWISKLWTERPPRYSRALMETLALIAYRQPITRGEIEDVRGVAVSTSIMRTLQERDWVRVVGHRDVPGKPAIFGTTKGFLDYFNIKSLDDLPSLAELRDIENLEPELDLQMPGEGPSGDDDEPSDQTDGQTLTESSDSAQHEPSDGAQQPAEETDPEVADREMNRAENAATPQPQSADVDSADVESADVESADVESADVESAEAPSDTEADTESETGIDSGRPAR